MGRKKAVKPEKKSTQSSADSELETAVEEAMEELNTHEFASSDVPRSRTIAFYRGIKDAIDGRIQGIREDMERDHEDEDGEDESDEDEG